MDADNYGMRTGLYTDHAMDVLEVLKRAIRTTGGKMTKFYAILSKTKLDRMPNNEVAFVRPKQIKLTWCDNTDRSMSDADFFQRFAWKLKEFVFSNGYSASWKRGSDAKITFSVYITGHMTSFTLTVGDAYFIYDLFLRRPNLAKKHGQAKYDEFVGKPLDPILTEMKLGMQAEIRRIQADFDTWQSEQIDKVNAEACEARNQIEAKFHLIIEERKQQTLDKIKELEDSIKAMASA